MPRYTDAVSDEALETIRANECEYDLHSLSTKRFRALWNEIERLRAILAEHELEAAPIAPEPFPDGRVEMHADGAGLTAYRLVSREEFEASLAVYGADRSDA